MFLLDKANETHKHSASDITSGSLAIKNGGTGATTAEKARENLGAAPDGFGLGLSAISISDPDAISGTGFYRVSSENNTAFDGNGGFILHFEYAGTGYKTQLFLGATAGKVAARRYQDGAWQPYQIIYASRRSLIPSEDATYNIGSAEKRFKDMYLANDVTVTSDESTKENIKPVDPELAIAFFKALGPTSTYTLKDGSSGRTHYGYTAQQVKAAMDAVGLSDKDFAGWINSPTTRTGIDPETGEEVEVQTGEYRQGLRYGELVNATLFPVVLQLLERVESLESQGV